MKGTMQVMDMPWVMAVVTQISQQGGTIQLVAFDGPGHYDIAGFIPPLKAAIPWIQQIWEEEPSP